MRRFLIFCMIMVFVHQASAFEFPKLKGWKRAGKVKSYTADNLWEYINGAAEQFIAFDFQELTTCDVEKSGLIVTVDIYDMAHPINAFGIYSMEKPEGTALEIGGEGIASPPYQALLFKDRYYVKVNTFEGELDENSAMGLLEMLAETLPGKTGLPNELELLPREGQIEGSVGYARQGFLGLAQLNQCIFATYHGDPEYQVFVLLPGSETVQAVWQRLADLWESDEIEGRPLLIKKVPYRGLAGIVRCEKKLLGVSDVQNIDILKEKIKDLLY